MKYDPDNNCIDLSFRLCAVRQLMDNSPGLAGSMIFEICEELWDIKEESTIKYQDYMGLMRRRLSDKTINILRDIVSYKIK